MPSDARRSKFELRALERLMGRSTLVSTEFSFFMPKSCPLLSSIEFSRDKEAGLVGKSVTLKVPSIV